MAEACLALGGNVGDAAPSSTAPSRLLCDGDDVRLTARSSDYRTPPWGFNYQPPFVNLCIAVETTLAPRELLARAQEVELHARPRPRRMKSAGGRAPPTSTSSPMTTSTLDEPGLTLPHPRLFERAFVLVPLAEIAPDRVIGGRTRARRARPHRHEPASSGCRRGSPRHGIAELAWTTMADARPAVAICADE